MAERKYFHNGMIGSLIHNPQKMRHQMTNEDAAVLYVANMFDQTLLIGHILAEELAYSKRKSLGK